MSDWLDFEKLIAGIYQTVSPKAVVKHNDSIQGKDSDIGRQIDISIRFKEAGCEFLIIVQAKNYKRPADINVVGEFASVIKDVRASKGVLICNAGFTKGAEQQAISLGIDLCSAHDAEVKNWQTTLTIPVVWENIIPHATYIFKAYLDAGDSISRNPSEWVLSYDNGKTKLDLIGTFIRAWNNKEIPQDSGKTHNILMQEGENLKLLVSRNKWQPVNDLRCIYFVERNVYRKDVTTGEFTGLRNYLTGNLEIQKLGVKIPPLDPEEGWIHLDQSLIDLVLKESLVITLQGPVIHSDQVIATDVMVEPLWKT